MSRIRIGRHFNCRGNEYVIDDFCKLSENGQEKPGVAYHGVTEVNPTRLFLSIDDFLAIHVPTELEVGDMVKEVSMGKVKKILVVSAVDDKKPYPVSFAGSDRVAKKEIDAETKKVEVKHDEQSTDFFVVCYTNDKQQYVNKICKIREYLDGFENTIVNEDFFKMLQDQIKVRRVIDGFYKLIEQ